MQVLKRVFNLAFWIALLLGVLLSILVSLARIGLPLVGHYQVQIERNLAQLTGMDVQVGRVEGELNGINIELRGSDIRFSTASQSNAISISHLKLVLDLPKSVVTLSPQFKDVIIAGVDVHLVEDGNGNVSLKGLVNTPKSTGSTDIATSRILNYAAEQQRMSLSDLKLNLDSARFGNVVIAVPSTQLIRHFSKSLIQSDIFINELVEPIHISAQISPDLTNFLQQQVIAYIDLPPVTVPLESFHNDSLNSLLSASTTGEFWLTYQPSKGISFQAKDHQLQLAFADTNSFSMRSDWRVKYTENGLSIVFADTTLEDHSRRIDGVNIKADVELDDFRTYVAFNKMDAQIASDLALQFVPKDWLLNSILTGLAPQGQAQNASLRIWKNNDQSRFQYLSNLVNAQVEGHNGIPKVNHVNAIFSLSDSQGSIEFKNHDAILGFPTLYQNPWEIDASSGEVHWQNIDNAFVVFGKDLTIKRHGATLQGGFRLEQPFVDGLGGDWLALDINAQNLPLVDRKDFIPNGVLSESLVTWLDAAIGDGVASNVDLLLRTGFNAGDPTHIRLGIDADIDQLTFDSAWPSVSSVASHIAIDNDEVNVHVESANLSGLNIKDLYVQVPFSGEMAGWASIAADVQGDTGQVMSALLKTPLRQSVLEPFADWKLSGNAIGVLNLKIPIDGQNEAPLVDLDVAFKDNAITIAQLNLPVSMSQGQLHYNDKQGIHDTAFDIKALGGTSAVKLSTKVEGSKRMVVEGSIKGDFDSVLLSKWQKAPQALQSRLQGQANYNASFSVGRVKPGQTELMLNTDLLGISLALPDPFIKRSTDVYPTSVRITSFEDDFTLEVVSNEYVNGKFLFRKGDVEGGDVSINKPLPKNSNLRLGVGFYGDFKEFDWNVWSPVLRDFTSQDASPKESKMTSGSPDMQLPTWIRSIDLIVDRIPVNEENELNNVKINYAKTKVGRPFSIASDELNAVLKQTTSGPDLRIEYLNWRTKEDEEIEDDKSDDIQPNEIPSMSLAIDQMFIDNRPYGDWKGKIVNLGNNSLRIDNISTQLPNGEFHGQVFWLGGELPKVDVVLRAQGENARELTKKFSSTPFLSSSKYQMDVALSWRDSLVSFDRPSLNGKINFNVQKGNFNQIDQLPPFLRLLGIFNVDAFAKRLMFDFSDLYEPGMPFDSFSSSLFITDGMLNTTEPIKINSPTAEITLEGTANLVDETLKERLTATVPITSSLPVAGLLLATPQIAGLLYITDKLIGDQLSKVTSISYEIEGSFTDPQVTPVRYLPGRNP